MRVCLVYDCLFPHTVGGAERWYRNLAERLAADGHEVTYLTLRQWPRGADPGVPGVRVVAVGPRLRPLHGARGGAGSGRRSCSGSGCSRTSCATRATTTSSTPPRSPTSACWRRARCGGAGATARGRLVRAVDARVLARLPRARSAAGSAGGCSERARGSRSTRSASRACTRSASRARACVGEVTVLRGQYVGRCSPCSRALCHGAASSSSPAATSRRSACRRSCRPSRCARETAPELRAEIYGDGPERERVLALVREHGLEGVVAVPGLRRARPRRRARCGARLCLVLPSRREGYGLVVVEACAVGHPERGRRRSRQRRDRADRGGRQRVRRRLRVGGRTSPRRSCACATPGQRLRASTAAWYAENARRLSLEDSARARRGRVRRPSCDVISAIVVTQNGGPLLDAACATLGAALVTRLGRRS